MCVITKVENRNDAFGSRWRVYFFVVASKHPSDYPLYCSHRVLSTYKTETKKFSFVKGGGGTLLLLVHTIPYLQSVIELPFYDAL